jgi:UDP-4-amino-4,6-dideoxy-N-acetyl-beta-L-altrosamine transaminase
MRTPCSAFLACRIDFRESPTVNIIPYGRQTIEDDDVRAVEAVLRSDALTTGAAVPAFETAFAAATGAGRAVSCSSATAGLHLALMAADVGPGDLVIVPSITFLATASAALYVGADIVFSDVDPDSGLMRPVDLDDALQRAGGRAKAVLPVHMAGQPGAIEALSYRARENNLVVIEDACHALGTTYERAGASVSVGCCADSDMAVFSFHPVKTIAMGEGGAVTTNDPALADRLARLRNHGMTRDASMFVNTEMAFDENDRANPWFYEMQEYGFNYRASDIHCALGLSQLGKLERFAERRRQIAERYDGGLSTLAPFLRPIARTPATNPVWHLYVVLIEFDAAELERAEVMTRLRNAGIGTQVHYIPLHFQPYYQQRYGPQTFPGAELYYRRCLSLPMFPGMADADVDLVIECLANILKDSGRS